MATKAQERAMRRYRCKTASVLVRVNPETEPEVYGRLMSASNKAGYLKALVLADVRGMVSRRA